MSDSEQKASLKKRWQALLVKLDGYAVSMRIFVLVATCFVVFLLWYLLLYFPLNSSKTRLSNQIIASEKKIKVLGDEVKTLVAAATDASKVKLKRQKEKLNKDLRALNQGLDIYDDTFIPASKMDEVMQDLLAKKSKLTLVGLEKLPETMVESSKQTLNQRPLYEYRIKLTFVGTYFDTIAYLKYLEKMKWQLFWDQLDYKVDEYPNATVTLVVHTLSQKRIQG